MSEPTFVLPAICDNPKCRTPFPSNYALGLGASAVGMWNCLSGPCPRCGGIGSIPNGWYSFRDLADRAVAEAPAAESEQVAQAVEALPDTATPDEVADAVEEAGGGRWQALGRRLRSLPHAEIGAYGALLVQIIRTAKGI